ncbi:MAG TPA: ABC transporter ATP-binding protein [Bacteroidales bacterium]|nr:ABC transporter ATP-binding protein [Bacteroidales bacterium]
MANDLITISSVKKSFGQVHAVKGVDFVLGRGEYVALLGPNGAGKTTLVEMIEGIRHPDSGDILIKGKRLRDNKNELYNILGISFQETKFFEKITVAETLGMFASFYGMPHEKVTDVMTIVGLNEKQKAFTKNLSGGQRQRLALGIAILNDPEILILDEPTTGLDPTARHEIWDILMNLKKVHNASLILTTHYMEEAAYLCDRIIIMDQGEIIAEGTLNQLLEKENIHNVAEFTISGEVPEALRNRQNGLDIKWDDEKRRGRCELTNVTRDLPFLFAVLEENHVTIRDFDFRKPSLDDLFLLKTGRRLAN